MSRRDVIILKKVIAEIDIGVKILGDMSLENFINDESWVYVESVFDKNSILDPFMQAKTGKNTSLLSYEELQEIHKTINKATRRYQVEI